MNLYNTWLTNQKIAHRGLHDKDCPENTLSAFGKAIEHNYAVEIDIQMTKDGQLVVFHDYDLERLTGLKGDITLVDYDYIKDATVCNSQEKIPTFEEFLHFIDGKIPVLIEIKHHKKVGVVEGKIAELLRQYKGQFAVQSFNPFIVKWFKHHAPEFIRGQLASDLKDDIAAQWQKNFIRYLCMTKINGSQFISYDVSDIKRKQILRKKKKMPIIMWTVRSEQDLEDTKGYYDNYIFEGFLPKENLENE